MNINLAWIAKFGGSIPEDATCAQYDAGYGATSFEWFNHSIDTFTGRGDILFSVDEILEARKDLGLIMSDEEEEMEAEERPKRNLYEEIKEGFDALESDRTDNVNKPKHYQLREGYEVYDLRQDLAAKAANGGATYDQYSDWDRAIEYIIRMWGKNRLEDAKKGRWYLDKLIEKLEKQ